jgi:structural hemagglutinin/hemolysin toxin protein RtxA
MYKLSFYVPMTHVESVKNALFAAGAGKIGNYSHCSWQVLGEGQYMPLENSHAFLGEIQKLEKMAEYKVEMVFADALLPDIVAVLRTAHPYEEPAFQIISIPIPPQDARF